MVHVGCHEPLTIPRSLVMKPGTAKPAEEASGSGLKTCSYCAPPPPAPPDPPPPVCGTPRAGCSALLPADELLVVVSAPVAVAGPVPVGAITVDPEPEVVAPAVPGTTTVPEGAVVDGAVEVWAKAVAAVKNAAEVNRASFVIIHLLTGFKVHTSVRALVGHPIRLERGSPCRGSAGSTSALV